MKTVYFLLHADDEDWIKNSIENINTKEIQFLAPTFEGQVLAKKLCIDAYDCTKEAWGLDRTKIRDQARNLAFQALTNSEITSIEKELPNDLSKYPLMYMHHSQLSLNLIEVIESWSYINQILDNIQPDIVHCKQQPNPYAENLGRLATLSGKFGMDYYSAKHACQQRSFLFHTYKESEHINNQYFKKLGSLTTKLKKVMQYLRPASKSEKTSNLKDTSLLMLSYGGYYFSQIKPVLLALAKKQVNITIINTGASISNEDIDALDNSGISFVANKNNLLPFKIKAQCILARRNIKRLFQKHRTHIRNSQKLNELFSDMHGSFYELAFYAIENELKYNLPDTVQGLISSEYFLQEIKPNVLLSHFDLHPKDTHQIIPALLMNMKTLGLNHGIGGMINSIKNTSASEYRCINGESYANYQKTFFKTPESKLFLTGDIRIDNLKADNNKSTHKLKHGFDPLKPLCIFCDNTSWRITNEFRNSEKEHLLQIISLKRRFPDLQVVYRLHHGANLSSIQEFIDSFNISDFHIQISPNPLFIDIVHAADFIITHYSSSIAESLACGVPVIYLCSLSVKDPAVNNNFPIYIADSFTQIEKYAENLLSLKIEPSKIRDAAQEYFDYHICGNDGKSLERFTKYILEMLTMPNSTSEEGYHHWKNKVELSSQLSTNDCILDYNSHYTSNS